MNDKRDMAPMVWGYVQSRETARRMDAYAGEVTGMHPHFAHDSPCRATDMDLATRNAYGGPNHITANIQHGSWTMPLEEGEAPSVNFLNSNKKPFRQPLKYSKEDSEFCLIISLLVSSLTFLQSVTLRNGFNDTARPHGTAWEHAPWGQKRATTLSSTVSWMRD